MTENTLLPSDARLFFIDAEGLVFREATQRLYGLNTFSAFLWSCLETNPSIPGVLSEIVEQLGLDQATAGDYTQLALDQWHTIGLLGDKSEPVRTDLDVQKYTDVTGIPSLGSHSEHHKLSVRLLDCPVSISLPDEESLSTVRAVIGHLEVCGDDAFAPTDTVSTIDVCQSGDHYTAYRNLQPVARFRDTSAIAPTVKSILLQEAIDHCDYLFYFHAGVLASGNTLVLLPGAQGAGKSTLTAGLVKAGLTYYSDEVALLQEGVAGIRPFPIALCSKQPAWATLQDLFDGFDTLPVHHRLDGKVVRYMPPPVNLRDSSYDRPLPVKYIVFPSYDPDAQTGLKPIKRVAALERLMEECLAIKQRLTPEAVAWLVEWIEGIDCYELPNSSLEQAVSAVKKLVEP